jgi:hypothetical protein
MKPLATVGCIGAAVLSWIVNQSVLWAILHFFCSWLYIVYWALTKTNLYYWLQTLVSK